MLRKAWRMRASSPLTSVLVFGSMPRIPATNTKSPARVPRLQVPVGLMAPSGASVLTPFGEVDWAAAMVMLNAREMPAKSRDVCARARMVASHFREDRKAKDQLQQRSRIGNAGLQRQRVQRAAHLSAQRVIDHLMLLHPRFAAERGGDHGRRIVIAIAGEVADRHLRVRDLALDQPLDLLRQHRHGACSRKSYHWLPAM